MLYIIRGVPGSGKTTFAEMSYRKDIMEGKSAIVLEADMYHFVGGKYEFSLEKLAYAHEWCLNNTCIFLHNGYNVYVSNTFTTMKEMIKYIDFCKNHNIEFSVYRTTKMYGSIHNVPESTIEKMKNRFEDFPGEILL